MTVLGAGLLWFGWFGFNAGSALSPGVVAVQAFVTTNAAAAAGTLAWVALGWALHRRISVVGATAGAVSGLVAITPAAGFVSVPASILFGIAGAVLCYCSIEFLLRRKVDDALNVFGVHGVGGITGALLTAVFADASINPGGADGLLRGSTELIVPQVLSVVVVSAFAACMTGSILALLRLVVPLRVSAEHEATGLDRALHGETAYTFGGSNDQSGRLDPSA